MALLEHHEGRLLRNAQGFLQRAFLVEVGDENRYRLELRFLRQAIENGLLGAAGRAPVGMQVDHRRFAGGHRLIELLLVERHLIGQYMAGEGQADQSKQGVGNTFIHGDVPCPMIEISRDRASRARSIRGDTQFGYSGLYQAGDVSKSKPSYPSSRRPPGPSASPSNVRKTLGPGVRRGDDEDRGFSYRHQCPKNK